MKALAIVALAVTAAYASAERIKVELYDLGTVYGNGSFATNLVKGARKLETRAELAWRVNEEEFPPDQEHLWTGKIRIRVTWQPTKPNEQPPTSVVIELSAQRSLYARAHRDNGVTRNQTRAQAVVNGSERVIATTSFKNPDEELKPAKGKVETGRTRRTVVLQRDPNGRYFGIAEVDGFSLEASTSTDINGGISFMTAKGVATNRFKVTIVSKNP